MVLRIHLRFKRKQSLKLWNEKDLIAQAQSGTGKTGAFSIGALQCVDYIIEANTNTYYFTDFSN